MTGFVEKLPTEWQQKWESMQMNSEHELEVDDGKHTEMVHHEVIANRA